jgi:hypothetical protein
MQTRWTCIFLFVFYDIKWNIFNNLDEYKMSVNLEKQADVPRIEGWWDRQKRSKMNIIKKYRVLLFIAGILFEISSDVSTLQLAYGIADKNDAWITFKTFVINGSVLGWLARGLAYDITKTILLPIAFKAIMEDIIVRSFPALIGGLFALVVSVCATMGIMSSQSDWETKKTSSLEKYTEDHNKTLSQIDRQISISNKNAMVVNDTTSALLNADRPRGAANIVNNITAIQKNNNQLLMNKLKYERPPEPEKIGYLNGVTKSISDLFGIPEKKARSIFEVIFSLGEEFLGVLCLTLGGKWVTKEFVGRKDDSTPLEKDHPSSNKSDPSLEILPEKPKEMELSLNTILPENEDAGRHVLPASCDSSEKEPSYKKEIKSPVNLSKKAFKSPETSQSWKKTPAKPIEFQRVKKAIFDDGVKVSIDPVKNACRMGHAKVKWCLETMVEQGLIKKNGIAYSHIDSTKTRRK